MGSRQLHYLAQDADVARDFPKYRIYRKGKMIGEYTSIDRFWQDDFVSFLIGCSFSFEAGLLEAEYIRFVPVSLDDYYDIRRMIVKGEYTIDILEEEGEQ